MRAIMFESYGSPDVLHLTEQDAGQPGPEQIQMRTTASGINFAEVMFRRGQIPVDLPHIPGLEAVGIVTAVGDQVTDFNPGDRVAAMTLAGGGQSEIAVADAQFAVRLDGDLGELDDLTAAAVLCNGTTAVGAIALAGRPEPADTVLVTAASGGVGSALLDLLSGRGLTLVAATSDPERLAGRHRSLATVISYDDIAEHGPYDVAFDSVGGTVRRQIRENLRLGSRHVIMGDAAQDDLDITCDSLWMSGTAVVGYNLGALAFTHSDMFRAHMRQALLAAAQGRLSPVVTPVRVGDVPQVHRRLEARETTGKFVLDWRL